MYRFFGFPGKNAFHVTASSVTQLDTLCQNISSGKFGGSLRTTILTLSPGSCGFSFRSLSFSFSLDFFNFDFVGVTGGARCVGVGVDITLQFTKARGCGCGRKGRADDAVDQFLSEIQYTRCLKKKTFEDIFFNLVRYPLVPCLLFVSAVYLLFTNFSVPYDEQKITYQAQQS